MPAPVIQPLSQQTILKIAAGEVIERPANVVKELVENALDAGATKVSVTLEEGGKELIRVVDNGFGMTRDDVLRCWMPHTTSKIRAVEDLESVASFGFRGEALASMASVSELTVETRHWEEEVGTRLRVVESRQEELVEAARGQGTTMTVRNLFRNNPVRRKFLGTARAETGRIVTLLTRLSLAHPGVTFRLTEGQRELLHLPEGTLRRRAGDVLGVHLLDDLVEVDWEGSGLHVQGFVSAPQRFSSRPSQQHFFVNRRNVYAPVLAKALSSAYEAAPPGRHPVAALFLTLSPAEIDVNVHPTKREIRFLTESAIYWGLAQALRRALRGALDAPALEFGALPPDTPAERADFGPSSAPSERGADGDAPPSALSERVGEIRAAFESRGAADPSGPDSLADSVGVASAAGDAHGTPSSERLFSFSASAHEAPTFKRDATPANVSLFPETPRALSSAPEFTGAPCLQIHGSFILVATRGGFLLVNQRAAHERILYEKALDDLRRPGRFSAQQLLFPELVEFSASEARVVEENLASLRALGFDLEPFGAAAFQLRGSPAEVAPEKAQAILQDLTGKLLDEGRLKGGPVKGGKGEPGAEADALQTRVARAYARAAAIPQEEPLDAARMNALVDGLFATQNPYVTPGGLPVLIRYSLDEIRRRFGLRGDED